MEAHFSQLSSQEAKSLFQTLDGLAVTLWIWEKGSYAKKIPIKAVISKEFTIQSNDDLIPKELKRASLLGTFEYKGFYYFLKLLSRDLDQEVQFLCDPILHKNERRKRRRFQIVKNIKDFQIVIPLNEAPPIIQSESSVISLFPVKLFKNFLSHLTSISDGKPQFHLSFSLFDISTSGLSIFTDKHESEFLESLHQFPTCTIILNKDKFEIKNLEFVHKSKANERDHSEVWRLGFKFVCDDWTTKKIQSLLEQQRENIVKEFDQWSK